MKDTRIAAVSFNSRVGQIQQNLKRMHQWIIEAKKKRASIICFPELNISGYFNDRSIAKYAEHIPGSIVSQILDLSRSNNLTILSGLVEKDAENRLFASHLVVSPDGLVGTYRKLHLAPPELGIFSSGDSISLFDIAGLRFGIQLCYDAHFPELSTYMAEKHADVIFIPHASPRGDAQTKHLSWMRHLPARAFDNGVFIVACNQTGENGKGLSFPGNSVVIGPTGEVLIKNTSGSEGMIIADLKAERLSEVRSNRMKYFLPNRRHDLFNF